MQHQCDTSGTHECITSAIQTTRLRHEGYTNNTSATRVKNFDLYIYYMATERLQGEEQYYSKNHLLEIPRFQAKMRLQSATQKLIFLIAKPISKSCTRDRRCKWPCTFPYSYAQ